MFRTIAITVLLILAAVNALALYCACVIAGEEDRRMNLSDERKEVQKNV